MDRRIIIEIATAIFIASIVLITCVILGTLRYSQVMVNSAPSLQHYVLAHVPIFGATTRQLYKQSKSGKRSIINRPAKNNAKISIFIRRGAVRNVAIFQILVTAGPLSIGDIQRRLNKIKGLEVTYYASLNKRIHALVRGGYIGEVKPAADQAVGFKVCRYEVRTKFYLAYYLNGKSRNEILSRLNEPNATAILSELINADSIEV